MNGSAEVRGSKAFRRAMPDQKPLKWPPRYANHRPLGGARTGGPTREYGPSVAIPILRPDYAAQPPAAPVTDERAFDLARRISDHLTTEEAAIAIMEYATDAIEAERAFWRSSAVTEGVARLGVQEVADAWEVLERHGFPPEAVNWPEENIAGKLPIAIDNALTAIIGARDDLLAEAIRLRDVPQPTRERSWTGPGHLEESGYICDCVGAVIGQHDRSCSLSRPNAIRGRT